MIYEEIVSSVRIIAQGNAPENNIDDILYRHKCYYLLSKLKNSPYKQDLSAQKAINRINVTERLNACRALFDNIGINYAVIKGAVLSKAAYNNEFLRSSSDVDILIDMKDSDKLKKFMLSEGFIQDSITNNGLTPFSRREILFQTAMTHQMAPFVKETGNKFCPYVKVDVNHDIIWGESKQKTDMQFVLSHVVPTELCGIRFNKLSPEMEFTSLCLHHYKDMNSIYQLYVGKLNLSLLCDIYHYIKNNSLDKQFLSDICSKLNVGKHIYYCIFQANIIFDDVILADCLAALDSFCDEDILDSFGLDDNEIKKWKHTLPERLFCGNIQDILMPYLSENDIIKIQNNIKYMQ